jgi:hypothetical protein
MAVTHCGCLGQVAGGEACRLARRPAADHGLRALPSGHKGHDANDPHRPLRQGVQSSQGLTSNRQGPSPGTA